MNPQESLTSANCQERSPPQNEWRWRAPITHRARSDAIHQPHGVCSVRVGCDERWNNLPVWLGRATLCISLAANCQSARGQAQSRRPPRQCALLNGATASWSKVVLRRSSSSRTTLNQARAAWRLGRMIAISLLNFQRIRLIVPLLFAVLDGWQSGRLRTLGKRVYPKGTGGSNPPPSAILA